jgi:hypothetical protein
MTVVWQQSLPPAVELIAGVVIPPASNPTASSGTSSIRVVMVVKFIDGLRVSNTRLDAAPDGFLHG